MMLIVTTTKSVPDQINLAEEFAGRVGGRYLPRDNQTLQRLQTLGNGVVIVETNRIVWYPPGNGPVFFHPGLAKLKVREYRKKGQEQLVEALGLKSGQTVLDCTLGLAADAIVASFAVGPAGKVVGIEENPVLAELVRQGLGSYRGSALDLLAAMRRIEVIAGNHLEYLLAQPDNSFDAVYFDPMFRRPVYASSSLQPVRAWVNNAPLRPEAIAEARRVARSRVVVKERRGSQEFARLGFTKIGGGRHSPVAYGIWEKT